MAMPEGAVPCEDHGPVVPGALPRFGEVSEPMPVEPAHGYGTVPDVTMPCHIALFDAAVNEQPPDYILTRR